MFSEISDDFSEGGTVPSLPLSRIRLRHLALMVYGDNAPIAADICKKLVARTLSLNALQKSLKHPCGGHIGIPSVRVIH